jgi:hypothetical protein
MKVLMFLFLVLVFTSCNDEKHFLLAENILDVTALLKEESKPSLHNTLKTIESLQLIEEQEEFYKNRIDYFIAVLQDDTQKQNEFLQSQDRYYSKFPDSLKHMFYWSRDIIDSRIMRKLEESFGDFFLSSKHSSVFFQGMVKIYN